MVVSPCLRPVRVYNTVTKDYHYVPCGHCDACLCGKGKRLSERLGETIARFRNKYFFTLTFSDEFLPVAKYDVSTDTFLHPYDTDYDGVIYSVDKEVVDSSLLCGVFAESYRKYDGVPVLSRRLAINFKKRLRKNFAKVYGKEYLWIYIVGEYGPSTLRPHYHGILLTNAKGFRASVLERCLIEAWSKYDKIGKKYVCQYGRIDFQNIVSKGAHSYVAQYLNCTTSLPLVYSSTKFRPFYQSSDMCSSDTARYGNTSLKELYDVCTPQSHCVSLVDNKFDYRTLPHSVVNRTFPKCFQFGKLSHFDRVSFYSLYESVKGFNAQSFAEYCLNCFSDSYSSIGLACQLLVDGDIRASKLRLVRHYYLSRRVCLNAFKLGVSIEQYVERIELFWSRFELLKLRNFYELQVSLLEDRFNPVPLRKLFSLYYDTNDNLRNLDYYKLQFGCPSVNDGIDCLSLHCDYKSLMHKIMLDNTKTKKRNDAFEKRGVPRFNFNKHLKLKKSCRQFFQI